jgi:hypothetical protein
MNQISTGLDKLKKMIFNEGSSLKKTFKKMNKNARKQSFKNKKAWNKPFKMHLRNKSFKRPFNKPWNNKK